MGKYVMLLLAEFDDCYTREEAAAKLDEFREAVLPSVNYGITLTTATRESVLDMEALDFEGEQAEDEEDDEESEPEEEDLVTSDHVHFYEYGARWDARPSITVSDGEDWRPHVKAYMDRQKFWPSVWFISDHGNAHLLDLNEED